MDDSIVRGTTTPKVHRLLRQPGAKEVHMRVAPAYLLSLFLWGWIWPASMKLIAARKSIRDLCLYRPDSWGI